jgi:2-polyprenyl-3-methyl-5-hydroxy-6-metoxy-1,4-benzoquinol methylase
MDLKELPTRSFARHPWESVRADFFLRLLRERALGRAKSALDIGAGDGYFAERLLADSPALARLACFDPAYDAGWLQEKEKETSRPRLAFSATKPEGRFDLVLMLDVLEHVEDDRAVLLDVVVNFLTPGGWLLLSVPAGARLFSRHDELLGHRRRYAPARLHALAEEVGLAIVDRGELFASLLLPRAVAKLGEVILGGRRGHATPIPSHVETSLGTWNGGPLVTSMVRAALSLDARCSRLAARLRLPFAGLSTWVLAQRP